MHHKNQKTDKQHVPVLVNEVLRYLKPSAEESYLDLTAGYGGHVSAVLERAGSLTRITLVDRDKNAINELKKRFSGSNVELRHQDFLSASSELLDEGRKYDLILADLGVSSPHLNEGNRGFAIQSDGPLDMRMDQAQAVTAGDIVNGYDEARLAEILKHYGEEPKAALIARLVVEARPLYSTDALAAVVARAWPGYSRVHPATRTFQALRIAVNDELHQIEQSLPVWIKLLAPGGRLAVISFHSLEDRLVKQAFQTHGGNRYDAELTVLTTRPVTATPEEIVFNPRARSAKLRAAVKK